MRRMTPSPLNFVLTHLLHLLLFTALLFATACSEDGGPNTSIGGNGGGGPISKGGGMKMDMGVDLGVDMDDMGDMGDLGSPFDVPANDADTLFEYLKSRRYEVMPSESAVHESTGPHRDKVLTYINPTLRNALGNSSNPPIGSAAIKELYKANGTTLKGWAVSVKVADNSDAEDWYWYESFDVENNNPVADGVNEPLCTGCHQGSPNYVLTPFPLQ